MIPPLVRPKRKNPIVRTRQPLLPPGVRSRAALGLTAAAALGRFELQVCGDCGAVQYPPREMCHRCLTGTLRWREQSGTGELIAETTVHHSNDVYFRERVPWRLGLVRVGARLDKSGQGVLLAFPIDEVPNMADDALLREMSCNPRFRKVLVTDGKTGVGQAVVRAIIDAGADLVWVGYAEPWKKLPGLAALEALPQAALLPLDLTDSGSVKQTAAEIGGRVDILINTAEVHRAHGDGRQLLRPPAPRPGVRAGHAVSRCGRSVERNRVGQLAVRLRSYQFSAARNLLRLEGGRAIAVAVL